MRKVIAAINMTLDGYCDHTAIIPDEELHHHYTKLLQSAGTILYGRITYQLMEYWRPIAEKPTGNRSMDEFAVTMDNIPKIVFSHTLKNLDWKSAKLATKDLKEEVLELKQKTGKDILVGSPSLIVSLLNLNLIDELQLCVHPVIAGNGLLLFKNINDRVDLKFLKTKTFGSGAIIFTISLQKIRFAIPSPYNKKICEVDFPIGLQYSAFLPRHSIKKILAEYVQWQIYS